MVNFTTKTTYEESTSTLVFPLLPINSGSKYLLGVPTRRVAKIQDALWRVERELRDTSSKFRHHQQQRGVPCGRPWRNHRGSQLVL